MRRYLTLVFLVFLAIPAGLTFSGCTRNPAGNYCNGQGYGLKNTDVYAIDLEPKTTGVSLAFGQTRQINAPTATTCKGTNASVSTYSYATTNNQTPGYLHHRQHVRRYLEPQLRRRHSRLHHLQPSRVRFPTPADCRIGTVFISASANS